jgi:hypothetical protein
MIDRQDQRKRFAFRDSNKRGVREIHGAIAVLMHQVIQYRQIVVVHGRYDQCAGANELPRRAYFPDSVSGKVK